MPFIIDTPENITTHLADLKAHGVRAVIRYEARPPGGGWKRLQPDEAKAMGDAGMYLGIVYETGGNHASYFSDGMGYNDASYARERVDVYGQPDGSAVYFAVDYDATVADYRNRIAPYFKGIKRAFSGPGPQLRIGCYGSGYITNTLKTAGLIDLRWITCSLGFNGSRTAVQHQAYELWQTSCDRQYFGIDADFNVANTDDWGKFLPFEHTPAPPPFEQRGIASWYDDHVNADGTPVNNATDMTAAHRGLPFGTRVKVTRISNGKSVIVTIHDRGPAIRTGRIIDLRPAAARALDMIDVGIAPVKLEIAGG